MKIRTVLAALLCIPALAWAQSWPSRPITIIVTTSPGTGIDVLARTVAQHLVERWKTGVAVDNRPGASGNIGRDAVARAAPDGYTLLMSPTSFATNLALNKAPFDPIKSFAPVALLATGTLTLLVSNDTPAKTILEFVALAKSRPGKLNYASNGNGTIQHLAMELFKLEAGIDLTHVPYKTAGPAFNDLVASRVDAMIQTINTGAPFVQAGKIKVLAVLDDERSPVYPSTPTFAESGYPKLSIYTWYGMFAPGGVSPEIVQRLNREVNSIIGLKEVQVLLEKQGLNPMSGPPSRMADLLKLELERWPRVVKAAGITGE